MKLHEQSVDDTRKKTGAAMMTMMREKNDAEKRALEAK
jgi:hypothetical protein